MMVGRLRTKATCSNHHGGGIVRRIHRGPSGFLTVAAYGRQDRAMAKRAVLVEAVKPVVETALVEDVKASQSADVRLILDLFQADYTNRSPSAYAPTMVR